jgi:hypothetical protein
MSKCARGLCFHGAFNKKSDAERKAATRPGAFVIKKWVGRRNQRFAFVVATPDGGGNAPASAPKRRKARKSARRVKRDRGVEFNPFSW